MFPGDNAPQTVGGAGKIPDKVGGGGGGGGGGQGGGGGGAGGSAVSGLENKISINLGGGKGGGEQIHYHYYGNAPPNFRG